MNKEYLKPFVSSILNSYSQIFFSKHKVLAVLIMLVTFSNVEVGLLALFSVLVSSTIAFALHLNKTITANGLYGFNSLLVGLGLGVYYSFSLEVIILVGLASMFSLFIAVSLQGVIGKYHLPYLSIPFLIALWVFLLASKHFEALGVSERGVYFLNDLYQIGGLNLVNAYEYVSNIQLPEILSIYLKSLSAIFFQYNILSGLLIAIGILLYSRIASFLSFFGILIAIGFYKLINAPITEIDYSYIGFNYILSSIAIGGYFLVPSVRSYFSVLVLIPLVAVLTISTSHIFANFGLPIYSLPFTMVVLLYLYVLKFRTKYSYKLSEVYLQYSSPEKNLYQFLTNKNRFRYASYVQIKLPFYGKWSVSQGHDGEYTHQAEWAQAWDFVILNKQGLRYNNQGDFVEDYYCYNKPVIAPADGQVVAIENDIEDNAIGEVNLKHNWGNTVIIKHAEGIYSKLCHLRKGSIELSVGDDVKFGQIIGKAGNSGRSPYPHLHFQIQAYPYIGSQTIDYPISNYIQYEANESGFKKHTVPKIDDVVSNIEVNALMKKAFGFVPGEQLHFLLDEIKAIQWNVKVDVYNQSYIECEESKAKAYFEQDNNLFFFTNYEGKKSSELFSFFLSAYNIQKGFYKDLRMEDEYSLFYFEPICIRYTHDLISPFLQLIKSKYKLHYKFIDDEMSPKKIILSSKAEHSFLGKKIKETKFEWTIANDGLQSLEIKNKKEKHQMIRINENA